MDAYLFIITASILFSIQFAFTKGYQRQAGTSLSSTFLYNGLSPIAFGLLLFFTAGMKVEYTTFSFALALICAIVANAITYYSIKALSLGSLSNYSLFLMAGGMVLPAIYGAFFGDDLGLVRILAIALVLLAVFIRLDFKEKSGKKALLCFLMLFVLNGLCSIIASVHESKFFDFPKVSPTQFSLLQAIVKTVLGGVLFLCIFFKNKENRPTINYAKASIWATLGGLINGIANLLLLLALKTLQPSLQYPIITGGCILLSAIVSLILKEKLTKRDWLAVSVAVIGTIFMFFT